MRIFLTLLMSCVFASTALAAGGGGGGGGNSGGARNHLVIRFTPTGDTMIAEEEEIIDDSSDDPRVIGLPAVVAPLSVNGRLTGFAYAHLRMRVREGADAWAARENAHYALDALIRAAHRSALADETGQELDFVRAGEVWAEALRGYYGADVVDSLEIHSVDTRILSQQ
jgi:hypothetical protein